MGDGIGGGLCEVKGERRGGGFAGGSIAGAAMSAAVAGETLDRLPPRRRMGPSNHPAHSSFQYQHKMSSTLYVQFHNFIN